jgi:uncharacterized protein (TIGR02246 family)
MRTTLTAATALLLAAFMTTHAAAADSDVIREAKDRAQIESLMWHYVRALDSFNAEAYAATFTPDGQFGSGATATKGREALAKMVTGLKTRAGENAAPMYHVLTNNYIEFIDKDHAHMEAYWMTVFGAAGDKTPARVAAAGREVDELVRVNGQWLIKLRDVSPKP